MKRELKNYRIVSDSGEAVVISRERFRCLLQTLDALAKSDHANRVTSARKQTATTGD